MKFNYQYRTSDNKPHDGVVYAASKDAAYTLLRARGIRPVRVEEAPGLVNKLLGRGKRWIAIALLSIAVVYSVSFALSTKRESIVAAQNEVNRLAAPTDRHQVYGDPAFMEKLERENYESVFEDCGDRYLAHFAQPGIVHEFADLEWRQTMAECLRHTLSTSLEVSPDDSREVRELKQIVLGMREELREYMSDGVGSYEGFVRRVEERQLKEFMIYKQVARELSGERDEAVIEDKNEKLRKLGIRTISFPHLAE